MIPTLLIKPVSEYIIFDTIVTEVILLCPEPSSKKTTTHGQGTCSCVAGPCDICNGC